MFLALFALAAVQATPRPADLVRKGEESAYAQELDQFFDRQLEGGAKGACPAGAHAEALAPERLGPASAVLHVTPDAEIAADAVVYKESLRVTGCGAPGVLQNIISVRLKAGGWYMVAYVPGQTRASPETFDALAPQLIRQAMSGVPADGLCRNGDNRLYQLSDTQVIDEPGDAVTGTASWRERWVQKACGQDRSVVVAFTASRTGVTFTVDPDWAGASALAKAGGARAKVRP
jgi:hypothetical protein